MENTLNQRLDIAAKALEKASLINTVGKIDLIHTALDAILDANLIKRRNNGIVNESAWNSFVNQTADKVETVIYSIGGYVTNQLIEFDIQWISDDWQSWKKLCLLLSEIAFLKETYQPVITNFDTIDSAHVEEFLKSISDAGSLPAEEIPDGIPSSHWWWWYPQDDGEE